MSSAAPDVYSFFKEFKKYKLYEGEMEKKFLDKKESTTCDAFETNVEISSTEKANDICKKFKIFYKFIIYINENSQSKFNSLYNNDFAYLNYWLNGKLRNTKISHNINVESFYESMSTREREFTGNNLFEKKLFHIKEDDFKNMELLISLENSYSEIFKDIFSREYEEKISCLGYYTKYINTYEDGIRRCSNNTNFCNALNIYIEKYNEVYVPEIISKKCTDKEIPKLPIYRDVSLGNKINVVGSILGPSFGTFFTFIFLYKLTPFGKWINAKILTKKEAHGNLYETDEQVLLNTSDEENINFGENAYHISYDAVGNL
ncbi:PIR Superfamily Protein [Plasmodium ovale curtisi]|uniref:PIR Superfamily Protein n=1 Tax=Plasmodium ovale curtisi TaxID=864141 RepID=A0A1A8WRT3_PLAOA|nr:PIR Superfamily Protein [Plasmodium ovale curtisi]